MACDLYQIIIIKIYCRVDVKIQLFLLNLNKIYIDCHIFLEYFLNKFEVNPYHLFSVIYLIFLKEII